MPAKRSHIWTELPLQRSAPPGTQASLQSPFDELGPSPLAVVAAEIVKAELRRGWIALGVPVSRLQGPTGGKMFGVLVAEDAEGQLGFLRAFSGTMGGRFELPGYARPIFDARRRAAVETHGEQVVQALTSKGRALASSLEVRELREAGKALAGRERDALGAQRVSHQEQRGQRRIARERLSPAKESAAASLHALDQESRRNKWERRELQAAYEAAHLCLDPHLALLEHCLGTLDRMRRGVCARLMREIHDTYLVVNFDGQASPLRPLYSPGEPPGGAGDCALPKLLALAQASRLRPLAMTEFWWGHPPPGGGRVEGAFYPACVEKCAPLLSFQMKGLKVEAPRRFSVPDSTALELRIVFEDEWIVVVDKPCGLLSVPSRGGDDSVQERLAEREDFAGRSGAALPVHRLDLDTSGLLVAARDAATYSALQRQFLHRSVLKRYVAIVDGKPKQKSGTIDLAVRVDVHDRPRQIHDPEHGRPAITDWEVVAAAGKRTRVAFFPRTGRTHQIRVHASHPLGLGAAIVGDRLYGRGGERLMLHAEALEFDHPATGARVRFESLAPF